VQASAEKKRRRRRPAPLEKALWARFSRKWLYRISAQKEGRSKETALHAPKPSGRPEPAFRTPWRRPGARKGPRQPVCPEILYTLSRLIANPAKRPACRKKGLGSRRPGRGIRKKSGLRAPWPGVHIHEAGQAWPVAGAQCRERQGFRKDASMAFRAAPWRGARQSGGKGPSACGGGPFGNNMRSHFKKRFVKNFRKRCR
jgi:hypothetical protein